MRLQRSFLVFLMAMTFVTTAQAYVGLKVGAFNSNGTTNFGGGVVLGIPLPVTGLVVEAEVVGYYDNSTFVDIIYVQPNIGAAYDFNTLITPDSGLLHPYVRAGLAYGFVNYIDSTTLANESAPGFYSGIGINFKLPVVTLGIEGNYNYINFNGATTQDYWNVFGSAAIRF